MKKIFVCLAILSTIFLSNPKISQAAELYDVIFQNITYYNSNPKEIRWLTNAIFYAAKEYKVDPILIAAVMETESHYNFHALSPVGAIGLMQLMPETARMVGVDPYDPLGNVLGGVSYLKTQLDKFSHWGAYRVTYAVAAYNAGPGAVLSAGGIPNISETYNYVIKVTNAYNKIVKMMN